MAKEGRNPTRAEWDALRARSDAAHELIQAAAAAAAEPEPEPEPEPDPEPEPAPDPEPIPGDPLDPPPGDNPNDTAPPGGEIP